MILEKLVHFKFSNMFKPIILRVIKIFLRMALSKRHFKRIMQILIGMLAYRQQIFIIIKKNKSLKPLNFDDFKFLFTLIRAVPDKLREYQSLPRESIKNIERLLQCKIIPKLHISRKLLLENSKFKNILKKNFEFWSSSNQNVVISSRLYFLYYYIVTGHNTIVRPLNLKYKNFNYSIVGNNSNIQLSINKNNKLLTFGQDGCVCILLIIANKVFFGHYSNYPEYQELLIKSVKKWLNNNQSELNKLHVYIISHEYQYYIEKLIKYANVKKNKTIFHVINKKQKIKLDILIKFGNTYKPSFLYPTDSFHSMNSYKEMNLSHYTKSVIAVENIKRL